MRDFKEFKAYFERIEAEIYAKFSEQPAEGISEDVTKGFQNCMKFLDDKLIKAGRQPFLKVVSQQSLDVA